LRAHHRLGATGYRQANDAHHFRSLAPSLITLASASVMHLGFVHFCIDNSAYHDYERIPKSDVKCRFVIDIAALQNT
jgi:hypothetical protein